MKVDKASDSIENARDLKLLARSQAGDSEAFGELWMYYKKRLYASTYRRVKASDRLKVSGQMGVKAEDIVNETFLMAWKRINTIPPNANFRMWLWGILRNEFRNYVRLFMRPHPFDPDTLLDVVEKRSPYSANIDKIDSDNVLRKYISRLPKPYREVLKYYYQEGMTQAEIGATIGESVPVVRRRLGCAIRRLSSDMEANNATHEDFN